MISHIDGRLTGKSPTNAVIDVGGVGYTMHIPVSTYETLGEVGSRTKLLTYLAVKDDKMDLFGFATPDERNLFLLFISVSGIGGRTAISILSGARTEDLRKAISSGDQGFVSSIRGIGKRTAERLIVELKDKVGGAEQGFAGVAGGPCEDAVEALRSLGVKASEAQAAVERVVREKGRGMPVEELVREALKRFS